MCTYRPLERCLPVGAFIEKVAHKLLPHVGEEKTFVGECADVDLFVVFLLKKKVKKS